MRILLVAALCLGVTGHSDGQDWSRFRGPNGSGIAGDAGYPTEFGPNRNLLWRTAVRPGKSSPVLSRRHIFLTAFDAGTLYTQCFDRETGRLVWERAEQPLRHEDAHVLNEPSAATPVTDGENVYVFFRDLGVDFVRRDRGRPLEAADGPLHQPHGRGHLANRRRHVLVLVLDQIESSSIVALSLATGEVQWTTPRSETDAWATPVLYERAGSRRKLSRPAAANTARMPWATGERLWTHKGLAHAIVASPVMVGDTVVGFGYGYDSTPPFSETLAKIDRDQDGRLSLEECGTSAWMIGIAKYYGNRDGYVVESEWLEPPGRRPSRRRAWWPLHSRRTLSGRVTPRELWRYEKSFVAVVPSPLVLDGLIYTVKNGGVLTVLKADTGEVVKMGRVGAVPASYSASPVTAEGRIYLANEDGAVAVLRAGKDWELVAMNELGEPLYATPALSEGRIVVRGAKSLFCFGSRETLSPSLPSSLCSRGRRAPSTGRRARDAAGSGRAIPSAPPDRFAPRSSSSRGSSARAGRLAPEEAGAPARRAGRCAASRPGRTAPAVSPTPRHCRRRGSRARPCDRSARPAVRALRASRRVRSSHGRCAARSMSLADRDAGGGLSDKRRQVDVGPDETQPAQQLRRRLVVRAHQVGIRQQRGGD